MKIENPTDKEITIKIKGKVLTVSAGEILENVSIENAFHWREKIHNFLNVVEEENKVLVCHNNKTLEISEESLQDHLNHGDTEGVCT